MSEISLESFLDENRFNYTIKYGVYRIILHKGDEKFILYIEYDHELSGVWNPKYSVSVFRLAENREIRFKNTIAPCYKGHLLEKINELTTLNNSEELNCMEDYNIIWEAEGDETNGWETEDDNICYP